MQQTGELKPVPGFCGYAVDRAGNIVGPRGWPLKQLETRGGYRKVNLYLGKKMKTISAHRVVWSARNGTLIPPGMQIDHINNERSDNRPGNLNLVTRTENNNKVYDQKRNKKYGSITPFVAERIFLDLRMYKDIAADLGVTIAVVYKIKNRRTHRRFTDHLVVPNAE
jgi:hypothetical protein